MAPRAASRADTSRHIEASLQKLQDKQRTPQATGDELSLCRKLRLCSALVAGDAGLVFLQLYMLPVLQALGVPVSLETVSGIISGSLALTTLPMLGCLSDGGSNSNGRKKAAVAVSVLVFLAGPLFVVSGCLLHTMESVRDSQIPTQKTITLQPVNTGSSTPLDPRFYPVSSTSQTPGTVFSTEIPDPETAQDDPNWMTDPLGIGIPAKGLLAMAGFVFIDFGYDLTNSCVKTFVLAATAQNQHVSLLVLGVLLSAVGGCVTAVLGLLDVGSFFTLGTSLDPAMVQALVQASIIIILAVTCTLCTLLSGHASNNIVDATHDITIPASSSTGRDIEQSIIASFPTLHTDAQENVIMATTSPYKAISATPTANPDAMVYHSSDNVPENTRADETFVVIDMIKPQVTDCTDRDMKMTCMASTPGTSKDITMDVDDCRTEQLSASVTSQSDTDNTADEGNDLFVTSFIDTEVLLDKRPKGKKHHVQKFMSVHYNSINDMLTAATSKVTGNRNSSAGSFAADGELHEHSPKGMQQKHFAKSTGRDIDDETKQLIEKDSNSGRTCRNKQCDQLGCCCSMDRNKRNLLLICLSTFFMAGSVQAFNSSATDYLGKTIFHGDPETDHNSEAYVAYQNGLRTGSLGMLLLNSAYILFSLVHRKILGCFGPKPEYLVFSTLQVGLLVTLRLTDNQYVFYVTSAAYGVYRSIMYTIPFMLANEMCQEKARSSSDGSKSKVGSTMALVTSMFPLSFVVVSSMMGPLIDVTGDPGSPMYYCIACSAMGAMSFAAYRQR